MKQVFIVIGKSGSRKSSTIRALTGAGSGQKVLQIRTSHNETINVFVCNTSLQEDKITPENFVQEVEKHQEKPDYILVALRDKASRNLKYPNADGYISYFRNTGWEIIGTEHLQMEPKIPANYTAHRIRERLNWL